MISGCTMLSSSLKCFVAGTMYIPEIITGYMLPSSLKCFLIYVYNLGDDNRLYHVVFVSQVFFNVYAQCKRVMLSGCTMLSSSLKCFVT